MDELLSTKWHILQSGATLVSRPELFTRLDGAQESKLTLISTPAGFGKTTRIGQWAARNQVPITWLSLDEEDNDCLWQDCESPDSQSNYACGEPSAASSPGKDRSAHAALVAFSTSSQNHPPTHGH